MRSGKPLSRFVGLFLVPFCFANVCFAGTLFVGTTSTPYSALELEQFTKITPLSSESTSCLDGTDFHFYFFKGVSNKLLINFEGGGACFDGNSAGLESISASCTWNTTMTDSYVSQMVSNDFFMGPLLQTNSNPYYEWNHLYIPYCTGDLHIGNTTRTYTGTKGTAIYQHNGFWNVLSALNWVKQLQGSMEKVVVSGCSAGGYASFFWTPYIAEYIFSEDVIQSQFSDSAVGIDSTYYLHQLIETWEVPETLYLPTVLQNNNFSLANYSSVGELYSLAADYLNITFSQFSHRVDHTQIKFMEYLYHFINNSTDVSSDDYFHERLMYEFGTVLSSKVKTFVGKDTGHCITDATTQKFFTTESSTSESFLSWLREQLDEASDDSSSDGPLKEGSASLATPATGLWLLVALVFYFLM
eukprot:GCRY01001125.1.p1 GENE.GCRY01001125.1~~GCRY01001125.1.p1  ORF type:complete len:414 (+),score=75.32 GCRY01001125.1:198-1439(+)